MPAGIGAKLSRMRSAERELHRLIVIIVSKSLLDVLVKGPVIPSTARDLFVKRYIVSERKPRFFGKKFEIRISKSETMTKTEMFQ
jgi:hypothetical protein